MKCLLFILPLLALLTCSRIDEITGGGNEEITGWVGRKDGSSVNKGRVILRKLGDFNRADTGIIGVYREGLTDINGNFIFNHIGSGKFSIEFNDNDKLGKLITVIIKESEHSRITGCVEPYGLLFGQIDTSFKHSFNALNVYATEIKQCVKVDSLGNFAFLKLPSGDYTMKVIETDSILSPFADTSKISVRENDTVFINNVGALKGHRIVETSVPPAGISLHPLNDHVIVLAWKSDSNASYFKIQRSNGDTARFSLVDSTFVNTYTDSGLAPNVKYYYRLSSVNKAGESPLSKSDSVTTFPPQPLGLRVKSTASDSICLIWDSITNILSYTVYKKTRDSSSYKIAGITRTHMFTDTNVDSGSVYCYALSASNASGESSQTDAFCIEAVDNSLPFEKYFSTGAALDVIRAVSQQEDGGFILCGKANTYPDGLGNAWLIKTNSMGNEVWSKMYQENAESDLRSVIALPDGGCIACGRVGSTLDLSEGLCWAVRVDKSGATQWSRTYFEKYGGVFNAITSTSDGNILLCGNAPQTGLGVKININGDTLWSRCITGLANQIGFNSILTAPSGEIAICGSYEPTQITFYGKGLFFKTDAEMKNYTYKEYQVENRLGGFRSFAQTDDFGFVFAGTTDTADTITGWAVRTDGDGNTQWSKTFQTENLNALCLTSDGNILLGGTGVLIKINGNGNELWSKKVNEKIIETIRTTFDGGFIVGGYTSGIFKPSDRGDGWIMKFDKNGNME
jgi:hypothetical protein